MSKYFEDADRFDGNERMSGNNAVNCIGAANYNLYPRSPGFEAAMTSGERR